MAHRLVATIVRVLRAPQPEQVHFHGGDHGRPYVCENPRCTSPGMDVAG